MKRFTETNKWREPWFDGLSFETKLVFLYLCDTCDAAGVWEPNYRMANFHLKRDVDWDTVRAELGDRLQILRPSGLWWLVKFTKFQFKLASLDQLDVRNPAHVSAARLLAYHGAFYSPIVDKWKLAKEGLATPQLAPTEPLARGLGEGEGEGEGEGKTEGAGRAGPKRQRQSMPEDASAEPPPFAGKEFVAALAVFEANRRERKKPWTPTARKLSYGKLAKMGEPRATAALLHSAENGWLGIFEPHDISGAPVAAKKARVPENLRPGYVRPAAEPNIFSEQSPPTTKAS